MTALRSTALMPSVLLVLLNSLSVPRRLELACRPLGLKVPVPAHRLRSESRPTWYMVSDCRLTALEKLNRIRSTPLLLPSVSAVLPWPLDLSFSVGLYTPMPSVAKLSVAASNWLPAAVLDHALDVIVNSVDGSMNVPTPPGKEKTT